MHLDQITCPHCRREFPVSEALQHQLSERVRQELQDRHDAERRQLLAQIVQERAKAKQQAKAAVAVELRDTQEQIKELTNKLAKAEQRELEIRRERRELEEAKRNVELNVERRLAEEKKRIEEDTSKRILEEHHFKDREKDQKISDLAVQLEEAKRRLEQGSQQAQGEVVELELEGLLSSRFPFDTIATVPKGVGGADVLQHVCSPSGQGCGTIIWESKRTKHFSPGWIEKLKDDQRAAKAHLAVLVSNVLPKDVTCFAEVSSGVWVCDYRSAVGLSHALRTVLTQVARTKLAARGMNKKAEVLFEYLTGPEFRQRVEAIAETFVGMQQDLDKEKQAYARVWAKREKQIERVISNTHGMYGDLQGLLGASMQTIPALESGEEDASLSEEN